MSCKYTITSFKGKALTLDIFTTGVYTPALMAERVGVVTDSTCDLPNQMARDLELEVVPLEVIFGQETLKDGIDINSKQFFERLPNSPHFPPSMGDFIETYGRVLDRTKVSSLYSVHLLASASKTKENAELAMRQIMDDKPGVRGLVRDSKQVSLGLGIAARRAAQLAKRKKDLIVIDKEMDDIIPRIRTVCVLPTLKYARKGGRLTKVRLAKSYLGSLLHIVPIIEFEGGNMSDIGTVRSSKTKRLEGLVQRVFTLSEEHGKFEEMAIVHGDAIEDAQWVAGALSTRVRSREGNLGIFDLGPTVGVHGGPGTIGVSVLLRA